MSEPDESAEVSRLSDRRARGELDEERLALAARLGDPIAIALLGAPAAWWPDEAEPLDEWFAPVAQDAEACARIMLGLVRSMLPAWQSSAHVDRADDTLPLVIEAAERALGGVSVSEDEWSRLESRLTSLYDTANGVRLRPGLTLDAIVTAFLSLVCTWLYDDGVTLRRTRLATMAMTVQAIAGQRDFARGPFADAVREVARWLLS